MIFTGFNTKVNSGQHSKVSTYTEYAHIRTVVHTKQNWGERPPFFTVKTRPQHDVLQETPKLD